MSTCPDCLKTNSSRFFKEGRLAFLRSITPARSVAIITNIHNRDPKGAHTLVDYTVMGSGTEGTMTACSFDPSLQLNALYALGLNPLRLGVTI